MTTPDHHSTTDHGTHHGTDHGTGDHSNGTRHPGPTAPSGTPWDLPSILRQQVLDRPLVLDPAHSAVRAIIALIVAIKNIEHHEDWAGEVPPVLLDLLARCWAIEDGDGGWNGGDVVNIVCELLDEHGINVTHPAHRANGTGDVDDYDRPQLLDLARTLEPSRELGKAAPVMHTERDLHRAGLDCTIEDVRRRRAALMALRQRVRACVDPGPDQADPAAVRARVGNELGAASAMLALELVTRYVPADEPPPDYLDPDGLFVAAGDLIANLLHLARGVGLDPGELLYRGRRFFDEEEVLDHDPGTCTIPDCARCGLQHEPARPGGGGPG